MPFFDPTTDPGSNFPGAAAPGRVVERRCRRRLSGSIDVPHATTCVALRFADGVVMAGDRRATSGNLISHRTMEKVVQADSYSGVAIAGAAGPAMEMIRLFQLQLEHYEKVEGIVAQPRRQGQPALGDGARQPAGGDAGHGRRADVRRLRPAPRAGPAVRVRRHRRPLRGARVRRHRVRQPPRRHRDQGRLPHRDDPPTTRSTSPCAACGRRPMPTRRPAAPTRCAGSTRSSPRSPRPAGSLSATHDLASLGSRRSAVRSESDADDHEHTVLRRPRAGHEGPRRLRPQGHRPWPGARRDPVRRRAS